VVTEYCGMGRKCAVTVFGAVISMFAGLALPVRSPVQWEKSEPLEGVAVSVTTEPFGYCGKFGLRETVPEPDVFTVSVCGPEADVV